METILEKIQNKFSYLNIRVVEKQEDCYRITFGGEITSIKIPWNLDIVYDDENELKHYHNRIKFDSTSIKIRKEIARLRIFGDSMKLHLGCGKRDFGDGWINITADNLPHVYSHDVTRLPFEDNTAELIYASHLIAYFDQHEIKEVLKEWYRVLKPGGTIRLATPDLNALLVVYAETEELNHIIGPIFGRWNPSGKDNTIYHKMVYDYKTLYNVLVEAGFHSVEKYDWKSTEHAQFDDHSRAHFPHDPEAIDTGKFTDRHTLISLNVEATKP